MTFQIREDKEGFLFFIPLRNRRISSNFVSENKINGLWLNRK